MILKSTATTRLPSVSSLGLLSASPSGFVRGQSCGYRVVPTEERFDFAHRVAIEQPNRQMAVSSTRCSERSRTVANRTIERFDEKLTASHLNNRVYELGEANRTFEQKGCTTCIDWHNASLALASALAFKTNNRTFEQ